MWPRHLDAADALEALGARLGELAGDAADLHDGQRCAVGEHGRHLQEDLQLLADPDRRQLVERLDAIAGLEQEGTPLLHAGETGAQVTGLTGEHQRRARLQARERGFDRCGVRPFGLLQRRIAAPGGG
jgi:hypothetical protein